MWSLTGWGVWFWIGPVVILVIVPAIDLFAGLDRSNPPDDVIEALEQDRYYRWITYLFLPIQYVGFVAAMYLVARGDPLGDRRAPLVDKVGLAVSIGCIGGIGINTAHELGHKKEANERWLSKIALAQSFYGHFYIEHNRGHHVRVATPGGPGVGAGRRELLPVLAAHGPRLGPARLEPREEADRPPQAAPVPALQRRAQRLADVGGAVGRAGRVAGRRDRAVPGDPGRRRLLAARGRQLHGALRDAAPEGRRRRAASATSGSTRPTPGTPTTSPPTCCSTTCSGTATTTPTRPGATRPCATTRSPRCCRPGTPA